MLTMRINRTLGTLAKLSWLPAIKASCYMNVCTSGQVRPQRPVMRGVRNHFMVQGKLNTIHYKKYDGIACSITK